MDTSKTMKMKALLAAAFVGAIGLVSSLPAAAQSTPSYATGSSDERIEGTVAAVNGPYNISVRDARGFLDNVTLHQGTIINPTGLRLAPGQSVSIVGNNQGSTFAANEIDTPYTNFAVVPLYPGYRYGFGYRPAYSLRLGFGFRG
jgi:hypothetical protein